MRLTLSGTNALLMAGCSESVEAENAELDEGIFSYASSIKRQIPESFAFIKAVETGGLIADNISVFDKKTNKLFVANNTVGKNRIDVLDFSGPAQAVLLTSIHLAPYGGIVHSVGAFDGRLVAAIKTIPTTNAGKLVIFNASDYAEEKVIPVGDLPNDIKYSPDGKLIVTANEGAPNISDITDTLGTISIISVKDNYTVYTLDFSDFTSSDISLERKGLPKVGPGSYSEHDNVKELIAISSDSKTAWVTLPENNGIAKVDLRNKLIEEIFPPKFKNYQLAANSINSWDRPLVTTTFNNWPSYGIHQPGGIVVSDTQTVNDEEGEFAGESGMKNVNRSPFRFTSNEGAARDYATFE